MLAPLVLASLLPLLPAQSGGELAFPVGPAERGTIRVRVVDRNRVPLAHATVRGVFEAWDAAALVHGVDGAANTVELDPAMTEEDGLAVLAVPAGGSVAVVVERPGFAPGSLQPLFADHAYELVLDFGASLGLVVEDEDGARRAAHVRIAFEQFPRLPRRLEVRRTLFSPGFLVVDHVPRGMVEVEALAADGSYGRTRVSVGSAWRYNATVFQPPARVVLHPTLTRTIAVAGREGQPIPGLEARLLADVPGTAVDVLEEGVRVSGVPPAREAPATDPAVVFLTPFDAFPVSVELWAPGYRSVRLSCIGDDPPSAVTFRYATRTVRAEAPPVEGELWTQFDPYDASRWRPVHVLPGADIALEAALDLPLHAPLVVDGHVAAWLVEGSGAEGADARWVSPASLVVRLTIDGHPVACGYVKLELVATDGPIDRTLMRPVRAWADPDGTCMIGGILPGRWTVALSTHLVEDVSESATVALFEGELREVELAATRGRDVLGSVVDENGAALAGGTVQVLGHDATVTEGIYPVGEDGTFIATGLVDGHGYLLRWCETPWAPRMGSFPVELWHDADGAAPRTAEVDLAGGIPDEIVVVVVAGDEPAGDR